MQNEKMKAMVQLQTPTDFQLNLFLDSGSAMAKLYLFFTHVILLE